MRFRKWTVAVFVAVVLIGLAGYGASLISTSNAAHKAAHEAARVALESRLTNAGFTHVDVKIVSKTDKVVITPKVNPSATPTGARAPKPKVSEVTYEILSATFDITGTYCRGNVEQRLQPAGAPYFDEIIFPDGADRELPDTERLRSETPGLQKYTAYANTYPVCIMSGAATSPA